MTKHFRHITLFLIAAVFSFAVPQTSAQTFGGTPIKNTATVRYSVDSGQTITRSSNTATIIVESLPLMTLAKSVSAAVVPRGEEFFFRIIVTNTGNVSLKSIEVYDTLDASFRNVRSDKGIIQNGVLTWPVEPIRPRASDSVTITVGYVDAPAGTRLTNVAYAFDEDAPPVNASASFTTAQAGSFSVYMKKRGPALVTPLDTVDYTISIQNDGALTLYRLSVLDTIRPPMRLLQAFDGATVNGSVVRWAPDRIAVGDSVSFRVRVAFDQVTSARTVSNTAHLLTSAVFEDDPTREGIIQSSTATSVLEPARTDLSLLKSVSKSTVALNDTATYTITARNTGNRLLTGVSIVDTVDAALFTIDTVYAPGTRSAPSIVTAVFDTIRPSQTGRLTFKVRSLPGIEDRPTVINTASASAREIAGRRSASAVVAITDTTSITVPSVTFAKFGPAVATSRDTVEYVITVQNTGPTTLRNAVVRDTLESGMVLIGASDSSVVSGAIVSWPLGSLAPGSLKSVTIRVAFPTLAVPRTFTNRAGFFAYRSVPVGAQASTTVTPATMSLVIFKTSSADTVLAGSEIEYTIRVQNDGNVFLSNVTVSDTLSAAVFDSIRVSADASVADSVVSAVFPSIAPGASRTITIRASLRADIADGSRIVNRAYARATGITSSSTDSAAIVALGPVAPPVRSLSFVKSASKDSALLGSQVTYTFRVTNTGNVTLRNILVSDTLAENIFDRSIILFPGVDRQGNVITAIFDSLHPGQTDTATFRLRLLSDLPSPTIVTNTAFATADSLETYQTSTVSLVGYESIVLGLTKTASADTVALGETFFYVIQVSNNGSRDLSNVVVTDTIPSAYLIPLSVVTNGTLTGDVVQATFADLWADDTKDIVIQVRARTDTTALPALLNRAYATSAETGGDVVTAEAAITTFDPSTGQVEQPLLYLTKEVSNELVPVGSAISYTLSVRNAGNVILRDVVVIDTIPPALAGVQVDQAGSIQENIARWTIDSLAVGERRTFGISGTIPDTMPHRTRISNHAYASSAVTPRISASANTLAFVPIADQSCRIHLQISPKLVIGNGQQAAVIEAFVSDTLGRPKPDGTPVVFRAALGSFSNGLDSIVVPTVNGIARDSLRAVISSGSITRIDVTVTVEDPGVCSAQEVVEVIFYPGAIAGIVLDNLTRDPYEGAVIVVYSSSGDLISTVTTGPDGAYLIPVPRTDSYTVVIITTDRFGQPITTTTTVVVDVPGVGGNPPVMTRNMITGKIFFYVSGRPIVAQRLKVVLVSEAPLASGAARGDDDRIAVFGEVDSTFTDSSGTYMFNNVLPGIYTVKVDHPYLGGAMVVGNIEPGQTIVDANIPIVLNMQLGLTKTGPAAALQRDTVTYVINVSNTGTFSLDSVVVIDSLDAAMEFISATAPAGIPFAYDPIAHQVVWDIGRMDSTGGGFTNASMSVTVRFADSISVNRPLTNVAFATGANVAPRLSDAVVTTIVRPELRLTKSALKRVVEVGDIATYTLSVTNAMPTFPVTNVVIEDRLPFGFSYAAGSSFLDSIALPDPPPSRMLRWPIADTILPGESRTLTYRTIVGAGALEGNGINTAEATALSASGRILRSGPVEERVEIRAGLFADRGLIIGKVFYDENRNAYQDSGEVGVKGIEIMTSTGLRVITGDDGKYSIPDVQPGEHVLRVRERSLPPGAALLEGFNDFAGDARSRFVHVTPSGIARADFYLFQTTPDTVVLEKTIAKVGAVTLTRWTDPMNLVFIEDERRAPMKLAGVSFETARADLREEAAPSLRELADIMREHPDVTLLIVGHTDTLQIRTRAFPNNMVLSLARADAVRRFLAEREGIDSLRIRTLGLGELRPIAWNRTPDGRALNRRVEFYFNDDFEPQPLTVASILMQIAVEYDGSVPARSISFVDRLDPRVRFVPGSGLLGDSTRIEPTKHNGEIHWTIPNLGKQFSEVLTYRVEIDKPDNEVLSVWTTTRDISIATDSGSVDSDTTISTVNHVAVAVRGRAANYVMSGILFQAGSAQLRAAALTALDGVADYLRTDPTATLVVEGHTDASPVRGGRYRSNVELSRARAEAVIDILARSHGISRARMQAFGFGALRPVASNESPDGRERNRRVELRLFKQEFISNVIQAGRIDSSHATVAHLLPPPSLDDGVRADTVLPGERYRLTLRVTRPLSSKTASMSIVDSLPSTMQLVRGSLKALAGITSVTGGDVIEAFADPKAEEMLLTFVVEIRGTMLRSDLMHHEFYAIREERNGGIVVDKHTANGNGTRITAEN